MDLETIYEAVLNGDADAAKAKTQAAVDAGISAADVLHKACIPAMTEVGRQFEISEKLVLTHRLTGSGRDGLPSKV